VNNVSSWKGRGVLVPWRNVDDPARSVPTGPRDSLSVLRFVLSKRAVNAASQYEKDFSPTRLCNWEKPSERCTAVGATSSSPGGQHKGRTKFVVDHRGYLVGPKRPKSAFNLQIEERLKTAPRWPQVCRT